MNESMVRRSRRECEHILYIHTRILNVAVARDAYRLKYSRFLVKVVHVARRIVQTLKIGE